MDIIDKENYIQRVLIFLLGVLILALNYNLMVMPNHFVIGGTSGIAVILEQVFGFDPVVTIYVLGGVFLIFSYLFLGKRETGRALIGSLIYPFMITLVRPICKFVVHYFVFDNILISVIISGCLYGIGNGLVYKVGFNTGGGDILIKLINKYD